MRISPRLIVVLLLVLFAMEACWVARQTVSFFRDQFGRRQVRVEMQADRSGLTQLFWNVGRRYNEADSEVLALRGGPEWRLLNYSVPRDPLLAVRLDPLMTEGEVLIRSIELRSGSGRLLDVVDLAEVTAGNQVVAVEVEDGTLRAAFAAGANDPVLNLGAMAAQEGRTLAGFPWLSGSVLLLLGGALFAMRTRTVVMMADLRRASGPWLEMLRQIDTPGKLTLPLGVMAVAAMQAALLFPLHQVIDLPLWDEANAMGRGAAFLGGGDLGNLPDSPLAFLMYAGLVRFFGQVGAVFAAHYLVKTALAVVVFLFSTRTAGSVLAGLALGCIWVVSDFQLGFPILVYQAALFWFLLGLLMVERSALLGVGCFALAMLTRQEYQFAGVIVGLAALVCQLRGGMRFRMPSASTAIGVLVVWGLFFFTLFHLSGWGGGVSRGWNAVQQHYAVHLQEEGEFPGNNAFLEYPLVTDRDFPGAETLADAFRVNSKDLIGHVVWNVKRVPSTLLSLAQPYRGLGHGYGMALALGLMIGGLGLAMAGKAPGGAFDQTKTICRDHPLTVIGVFSGFVVVGPGLIVYAKAAYLLPLLPLVLALVGLMHRFAVEGWVGRWNRLGALAAAVTGLVVIFFGEKPFIEEVRPRPVFETVKLLAAELPDGRKAVLLGVSTGSYADYLGRDRVEPIEPLATFRGGRTDPEDSRFARLVGQHEPDLILIDTNWRHSSTFDAEGETALMNQGWAVRETPGGRLLVRP